MTSEEFNGEQFELCSPAITTADFGGVMAAVLNSGVMSTVTMCPSGGHGLVNLRYTGGSTGGGGGTGTASATVTFPVAGTVISSPTVVTATATAAPGDSVARVEFLVDLVKQGESTTAPHAYVWDPVNVTDGPHTLSARVVTVGNQSVTSPSVAVTVTRATISLLQPAGPTSVTSGGVLTVQASAGLPPGTGVTKVEFLVNDTARHTLNGPGAGPYSWSFAPAAGESGTVYLKARLTTNTGAVADSQPVAVTILPSGGGGGGASNAFLLSENVAGSQGALVIAGNFGMKFTTGPSSFTAVELGRLTGAGATTAAHELVLKSDPALTTLASVTVPAGRAAGQYAWMPLATPVTLAANTSYWLFSSESIDTIYGCIPVSPIASATAQSAAWVSWFNGGVPGVTGCAAGSINVPVNLRSGGGGGGASAITITPTGVQAINPGQSRVFTATVASGTVTWSPATLPVTQGSVSISGNTLTYTAPASSASILSLTFTATQGSSSATAAVQVNPVGIALTGVTKNGATQVAPYTTTVSQPLQLRAELTGLAGGANGLINWTIASGAVSVTSLSPLQTTTGGWMTFTPSLNPGQVVLSYCSALDGNRCGQVTISVGAPSQGITLRPQSFDGSGFRRFPGSQLDFGVELIGLTAPEVTCGLNPVWAGTIEELKLPAHQPIPGFPRSFRVTYGANNTSSDIQFKVECGHPVLPVGWKESFPLTTISANQLPPLLTVTPEGPGSTTQFKKIYLTMQQNGSPLPLFQFEVVVSPVGQTFSKVNACAMLGDVYTGTPTVLPHLVADSGQGQVFPSGGGNLFFGYGTNEWTNSQCTLSQAQSTASYNLFPNNQNRVDAWPAIRYAPSFIGTHTVRAIVYNNAYVSSGWLPTTGGTLVVQ